MQRLRLPSEKDVREAYQQVEDAVFALVQTTFSALAEHIRKLEDQLAKNSRNSGKPTSMTNRRRAVCENGTGGKVAVGWDTQVRRSKRWHDQTMSKCIVC